MCGGVNPEPKVKSGSKEEEQETVGIEKSSPRSFMSPRIQGVESGGEKEGQPGVKFREEDRRGIQMMERDGREEAEKCTSKELKKWEGKDQK